MSILKKELSAIHLDEGNYPQAISLLQNHLQLNPINWEAYNLLMESYFRMNRFELAIEIFDSILKDAKSDCLWNNWIVTHLSNDSLTKDLVSKAIENSTWKHFINFNISICTDSHLRALVFPQSGLKDSFFTALILEYF